MQPRTNNILTKFSEMRCAPQLNTCNQRRLISGIADLDQILDGGLPYGSLIEWGLPYGQGGREILCRFLASATSNPLSLWCLWIVAKQDLTLYPPAWAARGVQLDKLRITRSEKPLETLRPVFSSPVFNIIVIDSPSQLSNEDCAFLQRQARQKQQIIMILRNRSLAPQRGNVWAKLRINAWQERTQDRYCIQVIRGLSPRQISLKMEGSW